jgi:hypothetical protein
LGSFHGFSEDEGGPFINLKRPSKGMGESEGGDDVAVIVAKVLVVEGLMLNVSEGLGYRRTPT